MLLVNKEGEAVCEKDIIFWINIVLSCSKALLLVDILVASLDRCNKGEMRKLGVKPSQRA